MKNILCLIGSLFLTFSSICGQNNSASDAEKLRAANADAISKYQWGKFDDALKSAKTALDLSLAAFGPNSVQAAIAYTNQGEIFRAKQQYREASDSLRQALTIYEKYPAQYAASLTTVLNSLGTVLALDKREAEAEPLFTQAVENTEKLSGKESKEVLISLRSLTDYYVFTKQFDKADDTFLRRYIIESVLRRNSKWGNVDEASDDRYCLMSRNFKDNERQRRNKVFDEKLRQLMTARFGDEPAVAPVDTVKGGVVNGRALSLPKPAYPVAAMSIRASGSVTVKVLLDENGRVLTVKAFCGNPLFFPGAEAAAREARFSPTTLGGQAVKVSGMITYNFIP